MEDEYVAGAINCTNVIWLKHLLFGMKEEVKGPIIIYCDNTSAINISKNLVSHTKSKHISIKYNYLKELVEEKEVKLEYINTTEQIMIYSQNHCQKNLLNISKEN